METDFVNEYIAKLTTTTHEQLNKIILLEAKLAMAEKASRRLQEQLDFIEKEESKNSKKSSNKEDNFQ